MNDSRKLRRSPELRVDVLTGRSVIVAAGRAGRPNAQTIEPQLKAGDDPFLEGREAETPSERYALRTAGTLPDQPGWRIRVVPNRYPMVEDGVLSDIGPEFNNEMFPVQPVTGLHEVVIECPDGRTRLLQLTQSEVTDVLLSWRHRLQAFARDAQIDEVIIFRNEGFSAGASLPHCHSQIVGLRSTTIGGSERRRRATAFRERTGGDLYEAFLAEERNSDERVVFEADGFCVLTAFAPRSSFHLRIFPEGAAGGFGDATDVTLGALAGVLLDCLRVLDTVAGPVSFNLLLPTDVPGRLAFSRWMLEIVPRMSRTAGWELMTDIDVVTTSPEDAATVLREQIERVRR